MQHFDTLINNLSKFSNTWNNFGLLCPKELNYNNFFPIVDKFLKDNDFVIVNGYNHESLELEYIIYYKGKIIDLGVDKVEFINPYWDIIVTCFKYLEHKC